MTTLLTPEDIELLRAAAAKPSRIRQRKAKVWKFSGLSASTDVTVRAARLLRDGYLTVDVDGVYRPAEAGRDHLDAEAAAKTAADLKLRRELVPLTRTPRQRAEWQ